MGGSIRPCPPLCPSVASAARAAWSMTAPSSLPGANNVHRGFVMEIRSFFPFNSCLKHKTSLLPSIHRTPPLFCQTSSQRRPRKMPGSKTNADQSKGVERNHCTGAARSNLRASLLGPNTDARAEPGLIPSSWHTGHRGATTIECLDSGPAPVPRAQARQIAASAPSASSQALRHLCITWHRFSSKTTKCFYGRKSPLTSPKFLRFKRVPCVPCDCFSQALGAQLVRGIFCI